MRTFLARLVALERRRPAEIIAIIEQHGPVAVATNGMTGERLRVDEFRRRYGPPTVTRVYVHDGCDGRCRALREAGG